MSARAWQAAALLAAVVAATAVLAVMGRSSSPGPGEVGRQATDVEADSIDQMLADAVDTTDACQQMPVESAAAALATLDARSATTVTTIHHDDDTGLLTCLVTGQPGTIEVAFGPSDTDPLATCGACTPTSPNEAEGSTVTTYTGVLEETSVAVATTEGGWVRVAASRSVPAALASDVAVAIAAAVSAVPAAT